MNIETLEKEIKKINFDKNILTTILENVELTMEYFENVFDPSLKILNYSDEFDFEAKPLFYMLINGKELENILWDESDQEILKEISELDMKFIFAYVDEISHLERYILNQKYYGNNVKFNN